jgi:hypothetical protein
VSAGHDLPVAADAAHVRARVHDALRELRGIRCSDPAAAAAIDAVKLTERTLEGWWAPTLDALLDEQRRRTGR